MDKELALAIDFKKAPKALQEVATTHYAALKAVSKLKSKMAEVAKELEAAEIAAGESAKLLRSELKNWEPEV